MSLLIYNASKMHNAALEMILIQYRKGDDYEY